MALQLQSLAGLALIPLIAWAISECRSAVTSTHVLRIVLAGIVLQVAVAAAMLNLAVLREAFEWPALMIAGLQAATNEGMRFVFGYLAGGPAPFDVTNPQHAFVLAFQALPIILLMSVLSRLLYHWGLLQRIVRSFAWALEKTLGVGGPVATAAAANIFVGMVEAPLLIRPYLRQMPRADLFAVMTVGMATIAGTVLALYASVLAPTIPGAAGHLIVASVISAPAAIILAALMVPATPATRMVSEPPPPDADNERVASTMDAITRGTEDGIRLLASVTAMLIVMLALIALGNQLLGFATAPFGITLTLEQLAGWLFAPLALLIGIPLSECLAAGELLGIKTVVNELVAFLKLSGDGYAILSDRSRLILTYALCGFANLGSAGILIGGLVAIAPERRAEIASLGMKSIVAGTLATLMTGAVIGVLTPG